MKKLGRVEKEKQIIQLMIEIYCHKPRDQELLFFPPLKKYQRIDRKIKYALFVNSLITWFKQ